MKYKILKTEWLHRSGVYKIEIDNKFYIGSSQKCLLTRLRHHLYYLKKNTHNNYKLQKAYNKNSNIKITIIEFCNKEETLNREQYYLDYLKPSLNISKDSSAPMVGRKHSIKSLEKMKGKTPWNKGMPRTEEEKLKMSEGQKQVCKIKGDAYRKVLSERAKKHLAGKFKGHRHTEENRKYFRKIHTENNDHIICINTGECFLAQIDAAKYFNIKQGHISEVLNGKRRHVKGLLFYYINKDTPVYKGHNVVLRDKNGVFYTSIMKFCKLHNLSYQSIQKYFINNNVYIKDNIYLEKYV
jgi:hypothetical protein